MVDVLQFPRGLTAASDTYVGPAGQVTVDIERWELRLHDNETPGGHRILNLTQLMLLFMSIDSEFGDVEFDPTDRGFLTRVADRTYAVRTLEAGAGIAIEEAAGTNGNPIISLGDLAGTIIASVAGRLPYAVTTGTSASFAATFPTGWVNTAGQNGPVGIIKFHAAPADGCTLSINEATSYPILTADGSNDINRVAGIGDVAMFVRADDSYYLIGLTTPSTMGILPIDGIAADNVQDALEELKSEIDAITGGGGETSLADYITVPSSTVNDVTTQAVPIADGESVWVGARSLGVLSADCQFVINGVEIYDPGPDNGFLWTGFLTKLNGNLYRSNESQSTTAISFPQAPLSSTAIRLGNLTLIGALPGASVNVQITGIPSAPKIAFSPACTPFVP